MGQAERYRRVVAVFEIERETARQALAHAERQKRMAEDAADSLAAELKTVSGLCSHSEDASLTTTILMVARGAAVRLESNLQNIRNVMVEFESAVLEPARAKTLEATKRVRTIEKLVEKKEKEEKREAQRRENMASDEIATSRWVRQKNY